MSSMTHDALEIFRGTTTSWIPLTTTFPSIAGCSTAYYVLRSSDISSSVYAYGPNGPSSCLPSQGTEWWNQVLTTATTTSIGPFFCPADYYTVYNISGGHGPSSTLIGCCPSGFSYESRVPFGNPNQCTSSMSADITLTYQTNVEGIWSTLMTPLTSSFLVRGVHINGWNWASDTSSSSTSTTATQQAVAAQTTSSESSVSATSRGSSGLSSGATAGIAVGATLAGIGLLALLAALFLVRRHRAKQGGKVLSTGSSKGVSSTSPDLGNNDSAWARTQRMTEAKGAGLDTIPHMDHASKEAHQTSTSNPKSPISEMSRGSSTPPSYGASPPAQELHSRQLAHEIGSSGERVMHEMP